MARLHRALVRAMRTALGAAVLAPNLRFCVKRWSLSPEGWGQLPSGRVAHHPLRIGILSDLHFGAAPVTEERVRLMCARLMATKPDLIVFLGDLEGTRRKPAPEGRMAQAAQSIGGLDAPFGTFAILGNHDWHDDMAAQTRKGPPVAATTHLENAGFDVLQNRAVQLRDDLWLAGLECSMAIRHPRFSGQWEGRHDLKKTLKGIPDSAQVILLAHEPDIFEDLRDDRVILTLSGHMHAGQIRLFGRPLYAPSRYGTKYAYGHYQNGPRNLIVSAGVGTSTISLRVGTVPELTVVDLA